MREGMDYMHVIEGVGYHVSYSDDSLPRSVLGTGPGKGPKP